MYPPKTMTNVILIISFNSRSRNWRKQGRKDPTFSKVTYGIQHPYAFLIMLIIITSVFVLKWVKGTNHSENNYSRKSSHYFKRKLPYGNLISYKKTKQPFHIFFSWLRVRTELKLSQKDCLLIYWFKESKYTHIFSFANIRPTDIVTSF